MARSKGDIFWTRDEYIAVLGLYLKMPFGKMHSRNPDVIEMSKIIGRTPSAVAMRLVNFASVDPFHSNRGIKGLPGGKKRCEIIFNEFVNNREELLFESEKIISEKQNIAIEVKFEEIFKDDYLKDKKGEDKVRLIKTRVNQHLFRQIVLGNYQNKCAISGIDLSELLVAGHIVPWSKNEKERLNPENGICLSNLYDRAFEEGYIGINLDYEIIISNELKKRIEKPYYIDFFGQFENKLISLPQKYFPNKDFLDFHLNDIFRS